MKRVLSQFFIRCISINNIINSMNNINNSAFENFYAEVINNYEKNSIKIKQNINYPVYYRILHRSRNFCANENPVYMKINIRR